MNQDININKKSTFFRLISYIFKTNKLAAAIVVLCIIITTFTSLASTLFMRTLIDGYIIPLTQSDNPQYSMLFKTISKLGLVLLAGVLCAFINTRIMIKISQGTMLRLRKELFSHMQTLPIRYFDSKRNGEIMSVYTNDVDTLRQTAQSLPQFFSTAITLVSTLVSMIVLSVPLTFIALIMAFVMLRATKYLSKRSRKYFTAQQTNLAKVNGYIEEMISGQKIVKVFCYEDKVVNDFEKINEQLRISSAQANKTANIVMPVNGNLGNLSYVLIAVIGASLALGGYISLSIGTLVSFLSLNKSFSQPIGHISSQINSIIMSIAGGDRVFQLMDEKPEEDDGKKELIIEDNATDIQLNHVNFSYVEGKQVLYDINLNAEKNKKIAFVGGTGAGKTTITNLLNRFYDIQSGEILYHGEDIKQFTKQSLRHNLGMVLQDINLFTGTVMDNIRYGKLDASDQDCIEAAKLIGADDFIRRLSDGYNTRLTANGGNLSQGERQLLSITRTAVANPPVLVLDEATSSIDTRTERQVQKALDSLMKGRTTFIIAHRLSTVRNADCIVVLEQGHIIEMGNHGELLAKHGKYYSLYKGGNV
ncbi:MAG: ABC transporter ATP-binding protein [Bacteroidales bacterium]|nr:ABC transporter ATP-binding protein [Bacteroidales bacterium]